MDISKLPRPSEEELPDMYDDINKMTKRAEELLREHFTITEITGKNESSSGTLAQKHFLNSLMQITKSRLQWLRRSRDFLTENLRGNTVLQE
mgnify:CR=1 FL=1